MPSLRMGFWDFFQGCFSLASVQIHAVKPPHMSWPDVSAFVIHRWPRLLFDILELEAGLLHSLARVPEMLKIH